MALDGKWVKVLLLVASLELYAAHALYAPLDSDLFLHSFVWLWLAVCMFMAGAERFGFYPAARIDAGGSSRGRSCEGLAELCKASRKHDG